MGPADNPYAAPVAELQQAPVTEPAPRAAFYAMSPQKAALMSLLTVSVYELCFWWRHWRTLRDNGEKLSVFWRTVFAGFSIFSFKTKLAAARVERGLPVPTLLGATPALYLVSNVIDNGLSRLPEQPLGAVALGVAMNVVRALLIASLQRSVNEVLEADGYRGPVNRGATARTYVVAALGLLFWFFTLAGLVLPEDQASS